MTRLKAWLFPQIHKTFEYDSNPSDIKTAIENIFSNSGGPLEGADFSGQFTSQNSFSMASVIRGAPILSFNVTTLWGRLSKLDDGTTQVEIKTKPPGEYLFALFIIVFISIVGLVIGIWNGTGKSIIIAILLLTGVPYFIAVSSKVKVERMHRRYMEHIHKVLLSLPKAPNTGLPK